MVKTKKILKKIFQLNKKLIKNVKFFFKHTPQERLFLYFTILFAAVSFLVVVEQDFDGETWDMGNSILYAEKTRIKNVPLLDYLNEKITTSNYATNIYETNIMFIPLWQTMTYVGLKIFGSIAFGVRFWLAIIGFTTIVILYIIGKNVYGPRVGLIAAITLATSIFYIIHVKSGFGYYAIMPLLVLLLFYFFYQAHKIKQAKHLYLSGVIIFFILFNGWPTMMLATQVMAVFVLINFNFKKIFQLPWRLKTIWSKSIDGEEKSNLLGLKHYLVMVLIGGGLFFISGVAYALYFHGPKYDVFEKIYIWWYTSRSSWFTHKMFLDPEKFFPNVRDLLLSFFSKMPFLETDGYLTTLRAPNFPMITNFTLIFLAIGVIYIAKRRLLFDKLCLIWLFFQVIGTTILAGFTARNWLFSVTTISLVSAIGLDATLKFLDKKNKELSQTRKLLTIIVLILFVYSAFSVYNYYFFYFVKRSSFLGRAAKQQEVSEYLLSVSNPKETVIVFDEFNPLPKDAFYFFSSGKEYETIYYWPELYNIMKKQTPENLAKWEQRIFETKSQIIYVITQGLYSHFERGTTKLWGVSDLSAFYSLHADLPPNKVIYYPNNLPATKIYVVKRGVPQMYEQVYKFKKNSNEFFWQDRKGQLDFLKIKGPATDSLVCFNRKYCQFIPFTIGENEELWLGKNYSKILFTPLSSLKQAERTIYEKKNIKIDTKDDSVFITSTANHGHVVFKLENDKNIKELVFTTYPRLNNDRQGKNKVIMQISEDGKKYTTVYNIKSDKGEYWEWPYIKVATHGVKTNSRSIFVKFIFEGNTGESQIWSSSAKPMQFLTEGEGWLKEDIILNKGLNDFWVGAKEDNTDIAIYSQSKIIPLKYLSLPEQDIESKQPIELEKGLYRLWVATKKREIMSLGENVKLLAEKEGWANNIPLTFMSGDFKSEEEYNYEFSDFPVEELVKIKIENSFAGRGNLPFFMAITPNDNILTTDNLLVGSGLTVFDPASISKTALYATGKGLGKIDLVNKTHNLKKGKYLVKVLSKVADINSGDIARVLVESQTRGKTLEDMPIFGHIHKDKDYYYETIAGFEVQQDEETINLKIIFAGKTKLWIDSLELLSVVKEVEAETLSSASGSKVEEDKEASRGKAMFEDLGVSVTGGYIFYGDPKIKLENGNYTTFFRMKVSDNRLRKAVIRIDNATSGFNYGSKDLWGSEFGKGNIYQYFSLPMNNYSNSLPLEFRGIWYPKTTPLWVDKIEIGTSIEKYQGEDFLTEGNIVYDPIAEGEKAVFAQSENDSKEPVFTKRINNFQSKKFRVLLRLKAASDQNSEDIARFTIYNGDKDKQVISKIIKKSDLGNTDQYRNIWFDVDRDSGSPIKLELVMLNFSSLWLDYIDIIPLD